MSNVIRKYPRIMRSTYSLIGLWIFHSLMAISSGLPNAIPLGIMYSEQENAVKDGANMAIVRHNRNNTRVLFLLNGEFGLIRHDPKNILMTMKLTCQILRRGFFILLAKGDMDTHSAYMAISNDMHVPYINLATPIRNETGVFEVNIYPPMEEPLADILLAKGWTEYNYLYTGDEAPLRSMIVEQYVQAKRYRPSRILLEPLPDMIGSRPKQIRDYFLKLKSRTGRNRTIIDTTGQTLRLVMDALKDVAKNLTNMHFIIASYELSDSEVQVFKTGNMNITMLTIFRPWNNALRDLHTIWEKADASLFSSGEKTNLTLQAALAYDAVFVAVTALNNILTKENPDAFYGNSRQNVFYNGVYRGLWCDPTKDKDHPNRAVPDMFQHGRRIARNLKEVQLSGVTGHIEFDEMGRRKNYFVETNEVEFAQDILSVTHTVWKHGVGILTDQARVSYKRTQDNRGRPLKKKYIITAVLREPFIMLKKDADSYNDSRAKYEGFCIELMKLLSDRIDKFDYEIVLAGGFGAKTANGWDGMIGELLTGKADMAIAPLTITKAREAVVDFSKPFLVTGLSIMIKRPEAQELSVFSFMQPLSIEVWMYIIFAYLGISVVIFLVSRFSPYEWRVEETTQGTFTISNDFSVYNCLWFTLAAFMQQGIDILPRSISGRIASSAWWFFTMIIVSSYTANLAAFLTLEKMNAPIESAEDLAKQTKIKYGIQKSGSSAEFFGNSTVQVYKRMWDYMNSQVPEVFVKDYEEGINQVRKSGGRYAFILEETTSEYNNNRKPCDTMKVGQNLNSVGFGVATPFGSDMKARINLAILELQETGELNSLHHRWWVKSNEGQCPQRPQEAGNSLTQNKVAGIFYILIGGMIVSLIAAFIEFLYRSRLEAQKSQKTMRSSMKAQLAMTVKSDKERRVTQMQSSDSTEFPWNN